MAIFMFDLSEGLFSAAGMKRAGRGAGYVFGVWSAITVVSGLAAVAGYAAGGLLDASGRAILVMLADTMISEAVESTHDYTGPIHRCRHPHRRGRRQPHRLTPAARTGRSRCRTRIVGVMLGAGVAEATGRSDQDVTANGSLTRDEIVTQPECWERAAVLGQHHDALPPPGARVLVLGCGTSYYVGQAYATLRERSGQGHTDATVASELTSPLTRSYDRVIAISRSGTTVDLVNALDGLPGALPVTVLLGDPDTPLGRAGYDVVDLQFADEVSVVQTRFATTGLSLLRASLGETLEGDVLGARAALLAELPAFPDQQLVVLAHGWATALAQEAALKCREAAGIWAEAYPDGEYRHGPLAVAGPHTLVWGLTPLSHKLVEAITVTGAHVEQPRHPAQAELVRLQRFAVGWAAARGRNADQPVHLSRSVTEV